MKTAPKTSLKDAPTGYRVRTASFAAGGDSVQALPAATLSEIAFAGRSNVGKSSLLNALLQRHNLVRTSRTPGCTRQINLFEVSVTVPGADEPLGLHLVDLPGYGYAKRSKGEKVAWGGMIDGYLRTRAALRAVVVLVDIRRGIEEEEQELLTMLGEPRPAGALRALVVATKLDKLPLSQRIPALAAAGKGGARVLGFSSETGEGREALWKRICASL